MAQTVLSDRCILEISGPDRVHFLQGLVSNDVTLASETQLVWAALLSPKGRYRGDFFIRADVKSLLLDINVRHEASLTTALKRYALRAQVTISPRAGFVVAGWECPASTGCCLDPRLPDLGWRTILEDKLESSPAPDNTCLLDYEFWCHKHGVPITSDYEDEETLLLEANFDCLNGISWQKGCYTGQEVTARMRYRGGVKKRLIPLVTGQEHLPPCGDILTTETGEEAGIMRTSRGQHGMALLRRNFWHKAFVVAGQTLTPQPPAWFPEEAPAAQNAKP